MMDIEIGLRLPYFFPLLNTSADRHSLNIRPFGIARLRAGAPQPWRMLLSSFSRVQYNIDTPNMKNSGPLCD